MAAGRFPKANRLLSAIAFSFTTESFLRPRLLRRIASMRAANDATALVDRLDAFLFHRDQLHQSADTLGSGSGGLSRVPSQSQPTLKHLRSIPVCLCRNMAAGRHFSRYSWHAAWTCQSRLYGGRWSALPPASPTRLSLSARSGFLLGIGEGFNWPGASKAVAEHFPAQERSLAVAIFDSGSSVGGAIAAIAIPWIALRVGWRFAFTFSGVLGFVWLALWLIVYPRSRSSAGAAASAPLNVRDISTWLPLLKRRETWALVIGRSLTDPIWWFYVFWLPQYFSDTRGFSLKQIAAFTWIPFVAADLGNFAGGLSSGALVKKGR